MGAVADRVTAKNSGTKFKAHPDGQFLALNVDCINLGEKVEDYPGTPKKLSPKCALVFRTGELNDETGEPIDISAEFTVSMGELANLRKFLEQWRGKPYRDEQIEEGVPLDKLVGNWALITVAHKQSKAGRTYAVIQAAVPVPKQMANMKPNFGEYDRAAFWDTRKKEYAEAARQFRAEIGAPSADEDMSIPDTAGQDDEDSDSSLPF